MSKIGKQPITLPESVKVETSATAIVFRGPKGELTVPTLPHIKIKITDGKLVFELDDETKQARSNWGTLRALAMNALEGVLTGYEKQLEIEGVGFRAAVEGKDLVLNIGYSHPVRVPAAEGVAFSVEKNTIKVSGIDKYLVGQVAADVRALKKPEPYKGKGIRYKGEVIRRKAGKKVAGTT